MWEAHGISDQGCVRENNEDAFHIEPDRLFIVADGMGGAQAGERASRLAIDTVVDTLRDNGAGGLENLKQAVEEANRRVREAAAGDEALEGMGTTLVAALRCGEELALASVGDSRAYLHDGGGLLTITEDQSWVNEIGRRLGLDESSLRVHPMRHMLTMAVGLTANLRINAYSLRPQPGTQILLSSDGLHGVITQDAIAEVLASGAALETKCRRLVEAAKQAGGPDNVTVILLRWIAD